MINFASLFNQFRSNSGSAINDLLEDPNTTIQKLLDEDSFSSEYKSGNSKVVQYLKYDKVKELVKFVTEVGPADDKKRGYKFPLVACEILSTENSGSIDFFFPDNDLFDEVVTLEEQEVEQEVQDTVETQEMVGEPAQEKTVIKDQLDNVAAPESTDESKDKNTSEAKDKNISESKEKETSEAKDKEVSEKQVEPAEQEERTPESTPKKKIIKTKVMVSKTEKIKVQALIGELFNYFKGGMNYPLAGYVSKIFISFFNKKPLLVMGYLLEETRFEQLLNHIESRSVGELVTKILTHESNDLHKQRAAAFDKCLSSLARNSQVHVMSNLSLCMCEIIEKVATSLKNTNSQNQVSELENIFFTIKVLSKLLMNLMSELENVSVYNAPILLTYLTNVPLSIPEDEAIKNQFKQLLDQFLGQVIAKLKVTREKRKNLGFGRVKIIEILNFILKADILGCRHQVGQNKELFTVLFNLWKNYPMNNILHNEVMKIVELAFNEEPTSPLLHILLDDDVLLNFLVEEEKEDTKIRSGANAARKGYIGHIIAICQRIDEKSDSNVAIAKLSERSEFKQIFENLVEKETAKQSKFLAGYSLRKNPENVLLAKQEIAQAHFKFLSSCPPPLFEPERGNINIQHPDLQATHNIPPEDVPELIASMATGASQDSQTLQPLQCNPKYWTKHIDYNLDNLMNDL